MDVFDEMDYLHDIKQKCKEIDKIVGKNSKNTEIQKQVLKFLKKKVKTKSILNPMANPTVYFNTQSKIETKTENADVYKTLETINNDLSKSFKILNNMKS
jgi:hypothetical protein